MLQQIYNASSFGHADRDVTNIRWPRVDIVEEQDSYVLQADIPGVDKNDIHVVPERGVLTISGEKKEGLHQGATGGYAYLERRFGRFSRTFSLPDGVDTDRIAADYHNGVLQVTIPKAARAAPRTITVKVE